MQCWYECKQQKLWFDEHCSKFVYQRKQAKLQLLQDPKQISTHNLNTARSETGRHFRNKKREFLKGTVNEF